MKYEDRIKLLRIIAGNPNVDHVLFCQASNLLLGNGNDMLAHECIRRFPDQKIQAIKEYRRLTGAMLQDAKEAIEKAMGYHSGGSGEELPR